MNGEGDLLRVNFDDEIVKLVENIANDEGFANYIIQKEPGSMKGFGYMGVITPIQLIGKDKSGKPKLLNLIVKSASKSDMLRKGTPVTSVFDREIYAYSKVIPEFETFHTQKGIRRSSTFAKCHRACMVYKSETLILENMKDKGFKLWDRKKPMNEEHVSAVMEQCGKFHAVSYAIRDQNSELFKKLTEPLHELIDLYFETLDFAGMLKNHSEKVIKVLDPVEDAEAYRIFQSFLNSGADNVMKNVLHMTDKYSAILHGDMWTNNMMFRYDNNNTSIPSELCLLDLQLMRVGSPVLDLSYFLYCCSDKQILNNIDHYLKIYHDSLSSHLHSLGSDPDKLYPYAVLQRQWKESAKYGLIFSFMLVHLMLSEQDEAVDLADVAESGKNIIEAFDYEIANQKVFNDRIRHIILHFVANKLI